MAVRNIAEITSDIQLKNAEGHILAEVSVNGNPWLSTRGTTVAKNNLVAPATAVDATGTQITGEVSHNSSDDIKIQGTNLVVPAGMYSEKFEYDLETDLKELIKDNLVINKNGDYDVLDKATVNVTVLPKTTSLTITPSLQQQDFNTPYAIDEEIYEAFNEVTVAAMTELTLPTTTAASATADFVNKATISRSTSDQFINIPVGYNAEGAYYQISGVPDGSVNMPSAAKGTVENNSISITPSVISTTGYITGDTISGTPVSVTAAELVSGTKTVSANGTQIDVTNFQYVDVTVPSEATPMTAATILSICTIE